MVQSSYYMVHYFVPQGSHSFVLHGLQVEAAAFEFAETAKFLEAGKWRQENQTFLGDNGSTAEQPPGASPRRPHPPRFLNPRPRPLARAGECLLTGGALQSAALM